MQIIIVTIKMIISLASEFDSFIFFNVVIIVFCFFFRLPNLDYFTSCIASAIAPTVAAISSMNFYHFILNFIRVQSYAHSLYF